MYYPHETSGYDDERGDRLLSAAIKIALGATAAAEWVRGKFRRLPALGDERIAQPIGPEEAADPRALAIHAQRALYFHNAAVAIPESDLTRLRARTLAHALLSNSRDIAMNTRRGTQLTFDEALTRAAAGRYATARASAEPVAHEHTLNLAVGAALDAFAAVNLEHDFRAPGPDTA